MSIIAHVFFIPLQYERIDHNHIIPLQYERIDHNHIPQKQRTTTVGR